MAHSRGAKGRARASSARFGERSERSPGGRSQRQLRVGEELRHALAQVLARGELRDPHLAEVNVTVTEVRVSPDLKNATAFVVPLGGGHLEGTVAALNHAASFLRGQLGHEVRLRFTPRLSFQADHSFDEAAHINEILHHPRVARDVQTDDTDETGGGTGGHDPDGQ